MNDAILFWQSAYENKWFARWAVVDKSVSKAVGTIEAWRMDCKKPKIGLFLTPQHHIGSKHPTAKVEPAVTAIFSRTSPS